MTEPDPLAASPAAPAAAPDTARVPTRRRPFRGGWTGHPAVTSGENLTLGERAADRMRNGMGSWTFVFVAVLFLAAWMAYNRDTGFDKYPFILLNLVLSCLAAMQGAILLIAAKRADQIASQLAHHDYETNVEAEHEIRAVHDRIVALEERIIDLQRELLEQSTTLLERVVATGTGEAGPGGGPAPGPSGPT